MPGPTQMMTVVLRAIALAAAAAVVVLTAIEAVETSTAISLLGVGLAALATTSLWTQ